MSLNTAGSALCSFVANIETVAKSNLKGKKNQNNPKSRRRQSPPQPPPRLSARPAFSASTSNDVAVRSSETRSVENRKEKAHSKLKSPEQNGEGTKMWNIVTPEKMGSTGFSFVQVPGRKVDKSKLGLRLVTLKKRGLVRVVQYGTPGLESIKNEAPREESQDLPSQQQKGHLDRARVRFLPMKSSIEPHPLPRGKHTGLMRSNRPHACLGAKKSLTSSVTWCRIIGQSTAKRQTAPNPLPADHIPKDCSMPGLVIVGSCCVGPYKILKPFFTGDLISKTSA